MHVGRYFFKRVFLFWIFVGMISGGPLSLAGSGGPFTLPQLKELLKTDFKKLSFDEVDAKYQALRAQGHFTGKPPAIVSKGPSADNETSRVLKTAYKRFFFEMVKRKAVLTRVLESDSNEDELEADGSPKAADMNGIAVHE